MSDLATGINFDGVAADYSEYDATLRGYVRYLVTRRNLQPYLAKKPLNILDVGGGNGPDTAWLAVQGHYITMVEASEHQLAYAARRFNFFLDAKERKRIKVVEGTLGSVKPSTATFDVVLLHGVAMYQPDPKQFITEVLQRVKPGGIVSLLEKGYYGAEARAIREMSPKDFQSLHSSQQVTNNLGRTSYAFKPAELKKLLQANGMQVEQWSGVRVVTDDMYMHVPDIDATVAKAIVDTEYKQGKNPSIRGQGQLLHFIARKI